MPISSCLNREAAGRALQMVRPSGTTAKYLRKCFETVLHISRLQSASLRKKDHQFLDIIDRTQLKQEQMKS